MELTDKKIAQVFKALSDENRVQIMKLLRTGEKCACKLLEELNISQPTLSHHMKILCDSGLVTGRKEGKWMHYSIYVEGCQIAKDALNEVTTLSCACEAKSCCEK
ncbi:MAG: winged helix-turn-helix transcriptional regulator [Oscillospiraceae bacterium]|nr:winged helix-turn-helix transcriptional regulator [Oscillospiraceae bacterium]